jgi:hypothetical protein
MNNLNGGELELAVVRNNDEDPGDKVKAVGFSTDAEIRIIPSIGISTDGSGNVESPASDNVNESSLETKVHCICIFCSHLLLISAIIVILTSI